MDEERKFGEWIDVLVEVAQKTLGLSLGQIEHRLKVKSEDVQTAIKLGGNFLVKHMD